MIEQEKEQRKHKTQVNWRLGNIKYKTLLRKENACVKFLSPLLASPYFSHAVIHFHFSGVTYKIWVKSFLERLQVAAAEFAFL